METPTPDKKHIPKGYVLYARAVLESRLWSCGPDTLRVATWILLAARSSRKPKKMPSFDLGRGELVTSLLDIADGTEWFENRKLRKYSRQKVSRIIKTLCEIGFCTTISDTYGTHLSVCNYDTYQNPDNYKSDTHGTVVEQQRDNSGTTVGTYNNGNNDNNGNNAETGAKLFGIFLRELQRIEKKPPALNMITASLKSFIYEMVQKEGHEKANEEIQAWLACYDYYSEYIKTSFNMQWPQSSWEKIGNACIAEHKKEHRSEPIREYCIKKISERVNQ